MVDSCLKSFVGLSGPSKPGWEKGSPHACALQMSRGRCCCCCCRPGCLERAGKATGPAGRAAREAGLLTQHTGALLQQLPPKGVYQEPVGKGRGRGGVNHCSTASILQGSGGSNRPAASIRGTSSPAALAHAPAESAGPELVLGLLASLARPRAAPPPAVACV